MRASELQTTMTLGRLATLGGAYGIALEDIADRLGAFAQELGELAIVTVPTSFDRVAVATRIAVEALARVDGASPDDRQRHRLQILSRERTRDVYVELETLAEAQFAMRVQAIGPRDLAFDLRQLVGFGLQPARAEELGALAVELGGTHAGVSDRVTSTGEHTWTLHAMHVNSDEDARTAARSRIAAVASRLGTGPQQRLVDKIYDSLAGDRATETWLTVGGAGAVSCSVVWTALPWEAAIQVAIGLHPQSDAGRRLGEMAGALESDVVAALELELGPAEPPRIRISASCTGGELSS